MIVEGVPLVGSDLLLQQDKEHADGDEKLLQVPYLIGDWSYPGWFVAQECRRKTRDQTTKPTTIEIFPRLLRGRLSWKRTAVAK